MYEHARMGKKRVYAPAVQWREIKAGEGVGQEHHHRHEEHQDQHEDGVDVGQAGLQSLGAEEYGDSRQNGQSKGDEQNRALVAGVECDPYILGVHRAVAVLRHVLHLEVFGHERAHQTGRR